MKSLLKGQHLIHFTRKKQTWRPRPCGQPNSRIPSSAQPRSGSQESWTDLFTYTLLVTSVSDSFKIPGMRPSAAQSQIRFPLTHLLGNGGSVRLLRALVANGGPLSVSQLAVDCGLSRQGTYQALNALVDQRIVRVLGQARSQLFMMDTQHPLSQGLKELFGHEQSRWDKLLQGLRETLQRNKNVHAAWYYGRVARGEDEPSSDLDIVLIAQDEQVDDTVEAVRQALREIEDRLYVSCSVVGLSPADVARLSGGDEWWQNLAREAKVLKGLDPAQYAAKHNRQETRRG
jgi:predicted nucleotidyltransferase